MVRDSRPDRRQLAGRDRTALRRRRTDGRQAEAEECRSFDRRLGERARGRNRSARGRCFPQLRRAAARRPARQQETGFPTMIRSTVLTLAGLIGLLPGLASAHPEDEILIRLLVGMESGKVTHIGESWTFDPTVSDWLIQSFDKNGDGAFTGDELAPLQDAAKQNSEGSFFYTRFWKGTQQLPDPQIYGFQATVKDGAVTMAFALALAQPEDPNDLRIEMYDPENLTGLVPVKSDPVVIRGLADGATCVPNVSFNQPDVHGGPDNIPIALTLACKG
ncbi:hypothetical protein B6V75_17020 [Thioclava sp. F1Mire-8]|nr:hypothetical protein B6V75_17020 [Thioclava sp. F1Mire-8]